VALPDTDVTLGVDARLSRTLATWVCTELMAAPTSEPNCFRRKAAYA